MNLIDLLTWIPLLAVLIAVFSLISQIKRSKFTLNVDIYLKLDDRFNDEHFRKIRRLAAKSIIEHTYIDAEEVLDFFETLGLLVRRRALDAELAWHSFFEWIHYYKLCLAEYISSARKDDPTIWQDFMYLHSRLATIEKRKRKCSDFDLEVSESDLRDFIRQESLLE